MKSAHSEDFGQAQRNLTNQANPEEQEETKNGVRGPREQGGADWEEDRNPTS